MKDQPARKSEAIDEMLSERNSMRRIRGWEALADAVRSETLDEYPMDRHGVDYSFGDIELEDGRGGYVPVRDLTDRIEQNRFNDPAELLRCLREALDRFPREKAG